jgi:hypothetical protein
LQPQLDRDLDAFLGQAAYQSRESTGLKTPTQRYDRVTQISMAIKATLKKQTVNEPAREKAMHAVLTGLSREPAKCLALLTSELNPEDFTRKILRSTLRATQSPSQDRSSPGSNGVDDITQVCNSQTSQQSLRFPINSLMQPTAEVDKTQRPATPVNLPFLSSSIPQPHSALHSVFSKSPDFKLFLLSELHEYLDSRGLSTHGTKGELIARCEVYQQEELAQQRISRVNKAQRLQPEAQIGKRPIKKVADTLSKSSDPPLPK